MPKLKAAFLEHFEKLKGVKRFIYSAHKDPEPTTSELSLIIHISTHLNMVFRFNVEVEMEIPQSSLDQLLLMLNDHNFKSIIKELVLELSSHERIQTLHFKIDTTRKSLVISDTQNRNVLDDYEAIEVNKT